MFAVLKRAWARGGVSLNPRSARDGKKERGNLGLRRSQDDEEISSFFPSTPKGWLKEG
jgi:hypothetical protein